MIKNDTLQIMAANEQQSPILWMPVEWHKNIFGW